MGKRLNTYHNKFTWRNCLSEFCYAHDDGVISIMVQYPGVDIEMMSQSQINEAWQSFESFLDLFGQGYTVEFHNWREDSNEVVDQYRAKASEYKRGGEFAKFMRNEYADSYEYFTMKNDTAIVISTKAYSKGFKSLKEKLKAQSLAAKKLEELTQSAIKFFTGATICSHLEYKCQIMRTFDLELYKLHKDSLSIDENFYLNEQIVHKVPTQDTNADFIKMGDYYVKTFFLYLYPDAVPGWAYHLANTAVCTHTVLILEKQSEEKAMSDSKKSSKLANDPDADEKEATKEQDLKGFRRYLNAYDNQVYLNCFIHTVYCDSEKEIKEYAQNLHSYFGGQTQWRDGWYMQKPFFRYSMPGLGYLSRMKRADVSDQAVSMIPAQVYRTGSQNREQLRCGYYLNPITFSFSKALNHGLTAAASRAGKDTEKAASIFETYPLGHDWYVMESDPSYKWTVESLGGVYSVFDPSETVVNPLPQYKIADIEKGKLPLDADLVGGTAEGLTNLLVDKKNFKYGQKLEFTIHEEAVINNALQFLYAVPPNDQKKLAPTLADLLIELEQESGVNSEEQRYACKSMSASLDSFLSTTAGRVYDRQNNLNLSEGITGVDIKALHNNPTMMKFSLSFLAIQFAQMAYMRFTPSTILLNELHYLARIAPEIIGPMASGIARIGGKRGVSLDLISQEKDEVDNIEKGIINQMVNRTFLYRADGHDEIAKRVKMPGIVLDKWKGMEAPYEFDWRPAVRGKNKDYYDLQLRFPKSHLDFTGTQPRDLEFKAAIEILEQDPFKRLHLLQRAKEEDNVSFLDSLYAVKS